MTFNIWNIIIIAGIIQGFIFTGIVLFNKKYHAKSTFFLVALIFIYSISIFTYILPDIEAMSLLTMYAYYYFPFASIIPVLIYFYVHYFLFPDKKLKLIEKLLFAPFIIFSILIIYFRILIVFNFIEVDPINDSFRFVINSNEIFSVIFSITLLTLVFIKISAYEKISKNFDIKIVRPDIKWLKITLSIIYFFTIVWAYLTLKNLFFKPGEANYYILWIAVAYLIYWLGHIGIYKYGIISERKKIRQFLQKNNLYSSANNTSTFTKSSQTNHYILALENLIVTEKMYLNSNLSLESVAEQLQLSPSYLSRIIHSEMGTSFPDYLNSYRIEEAKSYLKKPEFSKYTIISIGLEAGFNSKSSFYSVFKKTTGMTPLAYKKKWLQLKISLIT